MVSLDSDGIRLRKEADRVVLLRRDGGDPLPVKLVWSRPVSARGGGLSILDEKKNEVAMLEDLGVLDAESRRVAEEELRGRYIIGRIRRVVRTKASFGIRYWHVETDLGERRFAIKDTVKNVVWVTDDHVVLRDTLGCRYEINPFSALDPRSKLEVERVL